MHGRLAEAEAKRALQVTEYPTRERVKSQCLLSKPQPLKPRTPKLLDLLPIVTVLSRPKVEHCKEALVLKPTVNPGLRQQRRASPRFKYPQTDFSSVYNRPPHRLRHARHLHPSSTP